MKHRNIACEVDFICLANLLYCVIEQAPVRTSRILPACCSPARENRQVCGQKVLGMLY